MGDERRLERKRLLVLDDDESIRRSIARQLKGLEGIVIDFEGNPLEGLRMLGRTGYDLVLCDMKMRPVSGLEILAKIRRTHPHVPVIILTGFVDDQIIETARRIGASDFLIKPVRKEQLMEAVQKALGSR
jgi:CheY-like chemotaxis protein